MNIFNPDLSIQSSNSLPSYPKNYTSKTNPNLRLDTSAGIYNPSQDVITFFTDNLNALSIGADQYVYCDGRKINNLDYNKITLNKPSYFPADWNSTVNGKPDLTIYATNTQLATKQNTLTASTTLLGDGNAITNLNYANITGKPDLTIYATNTQLATKQNILTASTSLLGDGNAITNINYNNIVLNKPVLFTQLEASNIFITSNIHSNTSNTLYNSIKNIDLSSYYNKLETSNIFITSNVLTDTSNFLVDYNNLINKPMSDPASSKWYYSGLDIINSNFTDFGDVGVNNALFLRSGTNAKLVFTTNLKLLKSYISFDMDINFTNDNALKFFVYRVSEFTSLSAYPTNMVMKLHVDGAYFNIETAEKGSYNHRTAPLSAFNATRTSTTILNDPQPILNLSRYGTAGQSTGARGTFKLCRYENSGTNSRTRMDINLAHGDYDDINIMSIRSDGRVGIGVISPSYNLQVNGNVFCSSTLSSGSDISCAGALTVGTTLTISNILFFDDETNTVILLGGLNKALIGLIKPSSGGITPTPYSTSGSAGDLVIRSDVNKKLILQTSTGAGGIIINNNNVGINTNAPKDKLDIYGGNLVIRSAAESGNSIIYLSTPFDNNSALKCAMIAQGISSWSKSKLHFCLDDTNDNTTSASTTNSRLCITSDGKVGINITAPLSDLHIHKNTANGESRIMLTDNTTGSTVLTQGFHLIKSVAQTCYLWNYYNSALLIGTNNAEAIRINTLGFVGIGGIEPRYKLDVYAGHLCARSSTNTGIAGVYLGTPDTPTSAIKTAIIAHGIGSSGISDLKFCINNGVDSTSVTVADVKMMLTSGGLLGIQNNSPKAPLSIGNASLVNSDGWLMMGKNNGSGGTRQFRIGADSSFRTCIGDIGNSNTLGTWVTQFLIEWAAPASMYYNYQGNLYVTGWYYQHSDMKFKTNIKTIENSLIKILNLNGVSYTQKIEQTNHLGLIAQEVEGILPEVVSYDSEKDTKSISYTGIIPVLINAIKELNSIVLEQRNKINDLEQVLKKNNIF